jgi:hypothetical protein
MVPVHLLITLVLGASLSTAITFVAGRATESNSSLIASPNSVAGDGVTISSLVATARDAQGNAVAGVSIVLSASGGNTTFGAPNGTTLGDGSFATTITSTQMQTEIITARIDGNFNETVSVTFTGSPDAITSTLAVDSNSQTVGPDNAIHASLILRDAASNPLAGVRPTWSASGSRNVIAVSGVTSSAGVATAAYTSTLAQNENVQVAASGLSFYQPVLFVAGSPNAVTSYMYAIPPRQIANNSNAITASIMLRDAFGNGISGQTPTFSASGTATTVVGAGGTDSTGLAQATYKTGTVQNQNAQATVAGLTLTRPISFTGIPARCVLAVSPNSQIADGNSVLSLTATVIDGNNLLVPDILVQFSSTGAAQNFTPHNVVTAGSGQATSSLSSLYAGTNTIVAQAANVQCTSQGNFTARSPYCASNPNYNAITYSTGNAPSGLRSADFDGDGRPDLAFVNLGDNTFSVSINAGGGQFQASARYASRAGVGVFLFDDFDGDGTQDLVVADNSVLDFYAGTGAGTFQLKQTGSPDHAFGNVKSFSATISGDFNEDGIQDLAIANFNGYLYILLGTGTGMFQSSVAYTADGSPLGIARGDLNGDGIQDLVLTSVNTLTSDIFLGTGTGAFQTKITYTTGNAPYAPSFGDFDGDGRQDLTAVNYNDNTMDIFLGTGTVTLQGRVSYLCGTSPSYTTVGDLNGDGKQDIIVANVGNSTISVFLGAGTGTFQPQTILATAALPRLPIISDFDGDGRQDIAVVNRGGNSLIVFYNACN